MTGFGLLFRSLASRITPKRIPESADKVNRPAAKQSRRSGYVSALAQGVVSKAVAAATASSILISSLVGPLAPAYAGETRAIVDPTSPIQFRPSVTSSGNGTPTVNIVQPGTGGVSHNRFRQYDVGTEGLILNNSGLGGTSIIGGQVAPNPNLVGHRPARIILNEVTSTRRSALNGTTEVFGKRADVIVANPNGIGCVGCRFINTGTATLAAGVPVVDQAVGTVGFETTRGDVTVSGGGISAPQGQGLSGVRLIGRTVNIDGKVEAISRVDVRAGAARIDGAGNVTALASAPTMSGNGLVSSANGVISAGSVSILSSDIDVGVSLAGNMQALGTLSSAGVVTPGALRIVSAGDLALVSAEANGQATINARNALTLAKDLSASGEIAVTAGDIGLLRGSGVHAGKDLSIIAYDDIVSDSVIKSGGELTVRVGDDAELSNLIAGHDSLDLYAGGSLTTNKATLHAPEVSATANDLALNGTWIESQSGANLAGTNVTLGPDTQFRGGVSATAANTLTIGTLLSDETYPGLSLVYRNPNVTATGGLLFDDIDISGTGGDGTVTNSGLIYGRNSVTIAGSSLTNSAPASSTNPATSNNTGLIYSGGAVDIALSGAFTNLGRVLSSSTFNVVTQGSALNNGELAATGNLRLEALSYTANSTAAQLTAANANIILGGALTNAGLIATAANLGIETTSLSNLDGARIQAGRSVAGAGGVAQITLGRIKAAIAGDLTNLGTFYSTDTMTALVTGLVSNRGTLTAGSDLTLTARDIVNNGASATIGGGG